MDFRAGKELVKMKRNQSDFNIIAHLTVQLGVLPDLGLADALTSDFK